MIEDKGLGVKIAETTDESFWTEQKENIIKANEAEARNAKIREIMLKLCEKELSKFG